MLSVAMDCANNGAYQQMPYPGPFMHMANPQQLDYNGMNNGMMNNQMAQMVLFPFPPPEIDNENKPLMQANGRKVLGPPEDWVGSPPSSACELFVRRIPRDINEQLLIQQFLRFGKIYEIRLPMDFNQESRGYCYVKYTNEEDANCAMEVLAHFFVAAKKKLEILHSYEKCRLFVGNLPKNLTELEIEQKLRCKFPHIEKIFPPGNTYSGGVVQVGGNNSSALSPSVVCFVPSTKNNIYSRGCVIIQFPTHVEALNAKKLVTPGLLRMWGRDLKVVWANEERENLNSGTNKTLFLRNVDFTINRREIQNELYKYVSRLDVLKVSRSRSSAFIDFASREAAEICFKNLQNLTLCGKKVEVEWARPSDEQSLHRLRISDFDATLRLKCLANNWQIPIIIFGTYFENVGLQYCAVMLRNMAGITRAVFCIMQPHELVDIHSRLCELTCLLIETIGTFPDYNYVFHIDKDDAHLLGMVTHNAQSVIFIASTEVPKNFVFDLNEVVDLSWAIAVLSSYPEQYILQVYQSSFQTSSANTYLDQISVLGYRIFGTIHPNYRNKPQLKYNLNNSQIVLTLCYMTTGTNLSTSGRQYMPYSASLYDNRYDGFHYLSLKMLPMALTQSRHGAEHIISCIKFGGFAYYHPAQRFSVHTTFVPACSYMISIKNPSPTDVLPQIPPPLNPNCGYYTTSFNPDYNQNRNDFVQYNLIYPSPPGEQQPSGQLTAYQPQVPPPHISQGQMMQVHYHQTTQTTQFLDVQGQLNAQAQSFSQMHLHDGPPTPQLHIPQQQNDRNVVDPNNNRCFDGILK